MRPFPRRLLTAAVSSALAASTVMAVTDAPASPWAAYVVALAYRYHNVDFEVWNEPNLHSSWNGSISSLAALQYSAYKAVHNATTTDRVVSPGVAITAVSPYNTAATTWFKTFLSAAGGKSFGIVGIHMY